MVQWQTTPGFIANVTKGDSYQFTLTCNTGNSNIASFQLLAGELPLGLSMSGPTNNPVLPFPTIFGTVDFEANTGVTEFTVRASDGIGNLSDRSFNLNVLDLVPSFIFPAANLGVYPDGAWTFVSVAPLQAVPPLEGNIQIISGSLPGNLSLDSDTGFISGYINPNVLYNTANIFPNIESGVHPLPGSANSKAFTFTVQYDSNNQKAYTITAQRADQYANANANVLGPVYHNPIFTNANFTAQVGSTPNINLGLIDGGELLFQVDILDFEGNTPKFVLVGGNVIPGEVSINTNTGWLSGFVDRLMSTPVPYEFQVIAEKAVNNSYRSTAFCTLEVDNPADNSIEWVTPSNLGNILPGYPSTLSVVANVIEPFTTPVIQPAMANCTMQLVGVTIIDGGNAFANGSIFTVPGGIAANAANVIVSNISSTGTITQLTIDPTVIQQYTQVPTDLSVIWVNNTGNANALNAIIGLSFGVDTIDILNGGGFYDTATIGFTPTGEANSAVASALIFNGSVVEGVVDQTGDGYPAVPEVVILGKSRVTATNPIKYEVTGGTFPTGLKLMSNGLIAGEPSMQIFENPYTFTVTASIGQNANNEITTEFNNPNPNPPMPPPIPLVEGQYVAWAFPTEITLNDLAGNGFANGTPAFPTSGAPTLPTANVGKVVSFSLGGKSFGAAWTNFSLFDPFSLPLDATITGIYPVAIASGTEDNVATCVQFLGSGTNLTFAADGGSNEGSIALTNGPLLNETSFATTEFHGPSIGTSLSNLANQTIMTTVASSVDLGADEPFFSQLLYTGVGYAIYYTSATAPNYSSNNSSFSTSAFENFQTLVTSSREFTVGIDTANVGLGPRTNLWIEFLLDPTDLNTLLTPLYDQSIIPNGQIYRQSDCYFGIVDNPRMLLAYGISPVIADQIQHAMDQYFSNKSYSFNNLQWAQSTTEGYEVIYIQPQDQFTNANGNTFTGYISYNTSNGVQTAYPPTLPNMIEQLNTHLNGFDYRYLPAWMTDYQPNGEILGYTPAIPLVYCVPGSGQKILYYLQQAYGNTVPALTSINAVTDRLFWNFGAQKNWNPLPLVAVIGSNNVANLEAVGASTFFINPADPTTFTPNLTPRTYTFAGNVQVNLPANTPSLGDVATIINDLFIPGIKGSLVANANIQIANMFGAPFLLYDGTNTPLEKMGILPIGTGFANIANIIASTWYSGEYSLFEEGQILITTESLSDLITESELFIITEDSEANINVPIFSGNIDHFLCPDGDAMYLLYPMNDFIEVPVVAN